MLTAIYPPCIILVVLSFTLRWWNNTSRVVAPVMLVSLLFGMIDGIKSSALSNLLPEWTLNLPMSAQGLAWLLPSLAALALAAGYDRLAGRQAAAVSLMD